MKTKNWLIIFLIILAAVAVYFSRPQKSPDVSSKKDNSVESIPKFISGEVAEVSADRIGLKTQVFSTNAQGAGQLETVTKIVKVNDQIVVTSQANTKGVISITPASLNDIKVGSRLTIYYSASAGDEVTADRIQIVK